jgi:hypothetical protein
LLRGGTSFASTATVFVRKQKVTGSQDEKPGIPHAQPALVSSLAAARISLGDAGRNNPQ